jgi:hypothetical protein
VPFDTPLKIISFDVFLFLFIPINALTGLGVFGVGARWYFFRGKWYE